MNRASFLKRMAFAALATALFDRWVPGVVTETFTPTCWIGDVGYETLADAFDAVGEDGRIVLGPAPWDPYAARVSVVTHPRHPPLRWSEQSDPETWA